MFAKAVEIAKKHVTVNVKGLALDCYKEFISPELQKYVDKTENGADNAIKASLDAFIEKALAE